MKSEDQTQVERAIRRLRGIRRFRQKSAIYEVDSDGNLMIVATDLGYAVPTPGPSTYTQEELDEYVKSGSWEEIF